MSPFFISLKIWLKAILFTSFLYGATMLVVNSSEAFFSWLVVLIPGTIVTLPVLPVMIVLLRRSVSLPYRYQARMAWLAFNGLVLIGGIFALIGLAFFGGRYICQLTGITIAGVSMAVFLTRHSLTKFYNQQHEISQLLDPRQN